MATEGTYLARLGARTAAIGTVLCVGIDPDPEALPAGFGRDVDGIERFARLLVDAAAPLAAAVKINLAFFEAYGSAGIGALERVRAAIPPGIPVIADAKRGDIGSTVARQAVALFDVLGADAVTVSPYLGEGAIAPLLERVDRFAYVLCRTSNPGAGELQDLPVDGEPLWARVARVAAGWGPGGTVGLVVGATAPLELAKAREIAPGLAFLVPGVGAQGGDVGAVMEFGRATADPASRRPGGGLLVSVSRGIAGAATDPDGQHSGAAGRPARELERRLAEAAASWATRLPVLP
ncbi:MAG TPA: orotidine-5'-phosphate decarboxylase [Candidatus Eisenbacteria bacterium]|nr:orotidine-5'-phosphate decarboxylase [Candidatus Eisenbacteria bacterium]